MGIINQGFKPSLVREHTSIRMYKILARYFLTYGFEAWRIYVRGESRDIAAETKLMKRTGGYSGMDRKKYGCNEGTEHRTSREFCTNLLR